MRRLLAALAITGLAMAADNSVHELIDAVRTGLAHSDSDSRIAHNIHKLKLAEALDEHVIEELESLGAGPKTLEEMDRLRDESAAEKHADITGEFPAPEKPSVADQHTILLAAARYALTYTDSMPDFLCEQTVRRYERFNRDTSWNLKDILTLKLSYLDHQENYKLLTVNGRATYRGYESMGGALSKGEFASLLLSVFDRQSATHFWWDHWTTLRKRPAHVYSFKIEKANSHYHLTAMSNGGETVSTLVGEQGFVYIDRDSGRVLRIVDDAIIDPGFPVTQASRILDYDFTDIAGTSFLLPLHADIRMSTDRIHTRNRVAFSGYRKFAGESTITFK